MKRKLIVLGALCLFVFGITAPASAQSKFGFKLGGGLAYVGGGDINAGVAGMSDFMDAILVIFGATTSGGYEAFHLGLDFDGEFMFQITPNMALGLGIGYLSASKTSTLTGHGAATVTAEFGPKVSAIPITLNFHYLIPAGSNLNFVLHAGAGYYLASYTDDWLIDGVSSEKFDMSGGGLGFHGGVGLELALSPNFALTFDVLGRFASAGGFSGDYTVGSVTETNGKLWYWEATPGSYGTFKLITYDTTAPSGVGIANVHEAKLDLSGFSAKIGVLIRI
jgi:hypothetical protein